MPRLINRLNARKLPADPGRHADGGGLYFKVRPDGRQGWVFIYDYQGKRREKGLGSYPDVSLALARSKGQALRLTLAEGNDPLAPPPETVVSPPFSESAEALIESLKSGWKNKKHAQQWTNTLTTHASALWSKPIDSIKTADVMEVLQPIWTEIPETASRVRGRIERVLDAAKVNGLRTGDNPARWRGHLEVLLPKRKISSRGHHPSMPYEQVPDFMRDLRERPALSARALEFLILTAARTSEVIKADWSEFDLENQVWTVPALRMKAEKEHRVPLVPRAVEILEHIKFMNPKQPFKMTNMAMDMLLRRMDHDEYTVHGFRSSFRDWVGEETDYSWETAERAIAHQVGNETERAYRRGDAFKKRRELMEAWATYLE